MKRKSRYNAELVSQMSKPLDAEGNVTLLERLLAGDATAREEMIIGNMPLVESRVEVFLKSNPDLTYLRDDFVSAGFLRLTQAVDSLAAGAETAEPGGYLSGAIKYAIRDVLDRERPIYVPGESLRRAKLNGTPLELPRFSKDIDPALPARYDRQAEIDLRDLFDSCCNSSEERAYLAMREARHTLSEISEAIKMSVVQVHRMAKEMQGRILTKLAAA